MFWYTYWVPAFAAAAAAAARLPSMQIVYSMEQPQVAIWDTVA